MAPTLGTRFRYDSSSPWDSDTIPVRRAESPPGQQPEPPPGQSSELKMKFLFPRREPRRGEYTGRARSRTPPFDRTQTSPRARRRAKGGSQRSRREEETDADFEAQDGGSRLEPSLAATFSVLLNKCIPPTPEPHRIRPLVQSLCPSGQRKLYQPRPPRPSRIPTGSWRARWPRASRK